MSRYQIKFHLHTAKGKLITIPDLDIRRNELIHKILILLREIIEGDLSWIYDR